MSNSWNFYVEVRNETGWDTPDDLLPIDQWSWPTSFSWLPRYKYDWLFENEDALLPFRMRYPPDIGSIWREPTRSWLLNFDAKWVPYSALMVDFWRDDGTLLVEASVPVQLASLFGDGTKPFPKAALEAAGRGDEGSRIAGSQCRAAEKPIDRQSGYALAKMIEKMPEANIPVTWRTSIVELLGDETCDDFISLRRYGPDEKLRVIAFYS